MLKVWVAAAVPMAILAWVVTPRALARILRAHRHVPGAHRESRGRPHLAVRRRAPRSATRQGTLRWAVVKAALWLQSPRSPRTSRVGGVLWLVLIPCLLIFGAEEFVPEFPVAGRDLPTLLQSSAGEQLLSGSWTWFAVLTTLVLFNTVLGEELLFRGLLLPRMQAFGRGDWIVNGVLFAVYHRPMPWAIPTVLLDSLAVSYPSRRFRSALIGIVVHSAQAVVIALALRLAVS